MHIFDIKATVEKSNPRAIREILVREDTNLEQLKLILLLCFARENEKCWEFCKSGSPLCGGLEDPEHKKRYQKKPEEYRLKELIEEGHELSFSFGKKPGFDVRLEYEGCQDGYTGQLPALVRSRGVQPGENMNQTAELNAYCHNCLSRYSGAYELLTKDRNVVIESLNEELAGSFDENGKIRRPEELPDKNCCISARGSLESFTIDNIRSLASQNRLPITFYGNKRSIVQSYLDAMTDPENLKTILKGMDAAAYRTFKEIYCHGRVVGTRPFNRTEGDLFSRKLILGIYYRGKDVMLKGCTEMADAYTTLLKKGFEDTEMGRIFCRGVLKAGTLLYGVLTKAKYSSLVNSCYGKQVTAEDITAVWKEKQFAAASDRISYSRRNGFYYASAWVREPDAVRLAAELTQIASYQPTLEEIEAIEENEISFPKDEKAAFEGVLSRCLGIDSSDAEYLSRLTCECFHCGRLPDDAMDMIEDEYSFRSRMAKREIMEWLEKLQPSVRQIGLAGFNAREVKPRFGK